MLGDWLNFVYFMVPLEKPYVVSYDFVTYIVAVLKKSLKLLLVLCVKNNLSYNSKLFY